MNVTLFKLLTLDERKRKAARLVIASYWKFTSFCLFGQKVATNVSPLQRYQSVCFTRVMRMFCPESSSLEALEQIQKDYENADKIRSWNCLFMRIVKLASLSLATRDLRTKQHLLNWLMLPENDVSIPFRISYLANSISIRSFVWFLILSVHCKYLRENAQLQL